MVPRARDQCLPSHVKNKKQKPHNVVFHTIFVGNENTLLQISFSLTYLSYFRDTIAQLLIGRFLNSSVLKLKWCFPGCFPVYFFFLQKVNLAHLLKTQMSNL